MNTKLRTNMICIVCIIVFMLLLLSCQSNEPLFVFSDSLDFYDNTPEGEQQAIEMLNYKYSTFVSDESSYDDFHDLCFIKIDEKVSKSIRDQICEIIKEYFSYSPYRSSVPAKNYDWGNIAFSIENDPLFVDYNENRKEAKITTVLSDAIIMPLSFGKKFIDGNMEYILVYGTFNCQIYAENEAQFKDRFKHLYLGSNGIECWFLFQYCEKSVVLKSIYVCFGGEDGCQMIITDNGINLKESK